MAAEEKNAAEALRQAEAKAAEAATAEAIATAARSLDLTPPPSPGFVADVSAVVEADEASRSTAPAKRSRPSIEQTFHTYVGDLDNANREFDKDLSGGLEIEGEDDSKIRRLMVQMRNMKDDFRGIIENQAKTMDTALKSEQAATDVKVSTLNAALNAAESQKELYLRRQREAEERLEKQRADFEAERSQFKKELENLKADTLQQVAVMKNNYTASEFKIQSILPDYNSQLRRHYAS